MKKTNMDTNHVQTPSVVTNQPKPTSTATNRMNPANWTPAQFAEKLPNLVPPMRDNTKIFSNVLATIHATQQYIDQQIESLIGDNDIVQFAFLEFGGRYLDTNADEAVQDMLKAIGDTEQNRHRLAQYVVLNEISDVLADLEIDIPLLSHQLIEENCQKIING